jgi:hypothetical protein
VPPLQPAIGPLADIWRYVEEVRKPGGEANLDGYR